VQRRETVVTTLGRPAPSEAVREAVTMALYVGVVLAAEFVAVEEHAVDELSTVAVIWTGPPGETAVTKPLFETLATPLLLEVQVTSRSVSTLLASSSADAVS